MFAFFSTFAAFLVLGVPVVFVLLLAALAPVVLEGNTHLLLAFPQRMFAGVDQFVLLTIPLFLFAGNIMNAGAITEKLIRFCQLLVGRLRGGLAMVNVMASLLFGGISGAAAADAVAIGKILIPGMKKEGYDEDFAAALTGVSSVIGSIIPPSISMIIVGVLAGLSIADLFVAGIVPGVLLGVGLMIYSLVVAHRRGYPKADAAGAAETLRIVMDALPVLLLPAIILGGILGGVFTPTEAAAVASLYALVIAGFFYRTLKWDAVTRALYDTCMTTSAIMLVVAMANIVSLVFTLAAVPEQALDLIFSITDNKIAILLLINVFLLFIGAILEPIGALILTMPILIEVGKALGMEPLHLGVMVVLNLVIGLATPPVGICLFIVSTISKVPFTAVARAAMPMLLICLSVLLMITLVPELSTTLPGWLN